MKDSMFLAKNMYFMPDQLPSAFFFWSYKVLLEAVLIL